MTIPAGHPLHDRRERSRIGSGTLHFLKDDVGVDYHNDGHTHLDALCHIAYDGLLYNGKPEDSVTPEGAPIGAVDVLKDWS